MNKPAVDVLGGAELAEDQLHAAAALLGPVELEKHTIRVHPRVAVLSPAGQGCASSTRN